MSSAADPSIPGDYVAPGVRIPPSSLGFSQSEGLRTRSLYVEAVRRSGNASGAERILVRLDPDGPGPMDWTDLDAVRVTVLDVALVPDYDRNGKIDDADRARAAAKETFRFWINDDKDVGDVAVDDSDVPGQSNGNCADDVVNGRCDLLDFFPVWIDLNHILAALPPGNGVAYRLRSRGLKFVYTALTNERAGSCLREACDICGTRLNRKAFEAPTLPAGDAGRESVIDLSSTFLSAVLVDGNMVVSSAIADHNMAVSKYMMCDAAVASEAYDSTMAKTDDLVHPMWADHDRRTWAANWHELFSETLDSRRMLTWRNRLRPVVARTEVWSFFSTGDEVFDLSPGCSVLTGVMSWREYDGMFGIEVYPAIGNFGRYSWQKQELLKGARRSNGWNSFGGTTHAGWAFEASTCTETQIAPYTWRIEISPECANPATANALSPDQLRGYPAFKHKPDWLVGESTLSQGQIDEMLAMGIPALTPSAGRTVIQPFGGEKYQINLNSTVDISTGFKPNGWPNRGDPDFQNWLHNDMSDVAFYFSHILFYKVVAEGVLK